jgi:hypothetical protein
MLFDVGPLVAMYCSIFCGHTADAIVSKDMFTFCCTIYSNLWPGAHLLVTVAAAPFG